jgi:uncharacterized protein (AIM24 family)
MAQEVDYKIYGGDIQFVEIELDPNETVIAEPGLCYTCTKILLLMPEWAMALR